MCQTFLETLRETRFHVVALNDLCDLENEVKVTRFELGLLLALVHQCTKFSEDTSNISLDIERKPSCIYISARRPPVPRDIKHNTSRYSNGRIKMGKFV